MKYQTTIINLRDEYERAILPKPIFEKKARGPSDLGAGVWITGLYIAPRSGRMFVSTYSIWMKEDGSIVGTRVRELGRSDFLDYCQRVDIDPPVEAAEV